MMDMQQTNKVIVFSVCVLVIIVVVVGIFVLNRPKASPPTTTASSATGCRAQTFTVGASGTCVKDIQTMTDYMETADLTECPFTGGQTLPITGTYDSAT